MEHRIVIIKPNGNLVVPTTAIIQGIVMGDGSLEIDRSHPDYRKWLKWIQENPDQATIEKPQTTTE